MPHEPPSVPPDIVSTASTADLFDHLLPLLTADHRSV